MTETLEHDQSRPCRCNFGSSISSQISRLRKTQDSCGAYQILPPDSLLMSLSDLQPRRTQRSKLRKGYCATRIPIVMFNPGVSASFSAREMTCELSKVLKSSYSPAQTFLDPGNWAMMMASTFCKRKHESSQSSVRCKSTYPQIVLRWNWDDPAHCIFKLYRFLDPCVA